MARTTSDLLTNVKRRAQLPDDSGTLSDSDILAFSTDELQNVVMPRLMSMSEWHYAFTYNETVTSTRTYRISPRVAGNRIISVEYYDGTNRRFLSMTHPLMQTGVGATVENFAIFGNNITLSDACPTTGYLIIRGVLRPSTLVTSGCSAITASSVGSNSVTVDVDNFADADVVDVVYKTSPYEVASVGGTILSGGATTTYVLSSDVTVASGWANATRLCPAEQTDRVPLPDELHDYLAQRVAIRCMEARGFTQDMKNHLGKLGDLEAAFNRLMSPRVKGEFKAIVPEDYFFAGRP